MKVKARQGYGYTEYAEKCDKCKVQSRDVHENISTLNSINKQKGWTITYKGGECKGYCPDCKGE